MNRMVLEGIYTGIPRKHHKPIADGIVTGLKKDLSPSLRPDTIKVHPSATENSIGVFGAGRTPQGQGDAAKGGKMMMAHSSAGALKRRTKKLEEHIEAHNA